MITIEEFNNLKEKYENNDNHKNNKWLHIVLYYLSWFGNLMSIFLAFFILTKILLGAIENVAVVYIIAIVLLTGLELMKRDVFDKFSVNLLKAKFKFTKVVLSLLLFSTLISTTSFIATLSGAKEMASKQKVITEQQTTKQNTYADSLSVVYNKKIADLEAQQKDNQAKIDSKDDEQTTLSSQDKLSSTQLRRINDLKNDIKTLRADNDKIDDDISSTKQEMTTKISQYNSQVGTETDAAKKENNTNVLWFVILSTLVEAIILIGVYYNEYYKYISYKEYRDKIEKDPEFQKWTLYNKLLDIIYTEDIKVNDKLMSSKNILDICKINSVGLLPKDLTNFFKVMNGMGIFRTSGSARYIAKSRDVADELLKKHFNIK